MTHTPRAEQVAELSRDGIEMVVANDAERSSFSVKTSQSLLLISGVDLSVLHRWQLGPDPTSPFDGWGTHGASVHGPVALVATPDAVQMLEPDGSLRWSFPHASWAGIGTGCAWFDAEGTPFAVVAAGDGTACTIVALDLTSGAQRAAYRLEPNDPAGMAPLHHPGSWVGIAESEGENASRAWWVRPSNHGLTVLAAPWDDEDLSDVGRAGSQILTTALDTGCLRIRSFPGLRVMREIIVGGENFVLGACFAHTMIVARLYYRGVTVAIDKENRIDELEVDDGWVLPAAAGTWLSVRKDTLRRWSLV